jgi:hypothetical protein
MQGTWKRSKKKRAKRQDRKQARKKDEKIISKRINEDKDRTRERAQYLI